MGNLNWILRHYRLLGVAALIAAVNVIFFFIGPGQVVDYIGAHNVYIVAFLIAAVGGMSSFTAATYVTSIVTFTAGGADPVLIGLSGGIGIFISDSIFFALVRYGRESVPVKWKRAIDRMTERARTLPRFAVMLGTYAYQGLLPLPTDILMFALAFAGYQYRTIALPLFLGSITLSLLIAHFGSLWF